MQKELIRYQATGCRAALGRLVVVSEPIRRRVARQVAMRSGRLQDANLIDEMIAASAYRLFMMSRSLLSLPVTSEKQLEAYISKLARGAAIDATDDPIYGPTRRNLARRVDPTEAPVAIPWPDESFHGELGEDAPTWSHDSLRGCDHWELVNWVEMTAKAVATDWERIAINQVLKGHTDAATAAAIGIGMSKSTWQIRRREALASLAPKLVAKADERISAIAEKYLGFLWFAAASDEEPAVIHREDQRDAA